MAKNRVVSINFAAFADNTIGVTVTRYNGSGRTQRHFRLPSSDYRVRAAAIWADQNCNNKNWERVNALRLLPYMMNDYHYSVNTPDELMRGYVRYMLMKY